MDMIPTVVALTSVLWIFWTYLRHRKVNSILKNLPGPEPESFWKGNVGQYIDRLGGKFQRHIALDYGLVVRLHGLAGMPLLYVADPRALHHMLIKEESTFEETKIFLKTNATVFGPSLVSTVGEHHQKQKKSLSPAFTVNHMREMLPIFYTVAHKLRDAIATRVRDGQHEIDILGWTGRAALELIGQGGLGYSFDPLTNDKRDAYAEAVKAFLPVLQETSVFRPLLPYVSGVGPAWLQRYIMDRFPSKWVREVKAIVDTMTERSKEIYNQKKDALVHGDKAMVQQVGEGRDVMSILLKENMLASDKDKLPEDELIAQMSTLIIGALDSTSSMLSRILLLLAEHPDMQEKLRAEVLAAHAADSIPYDVLNSLPVLDAVCRETLRLYPPATYLTRVPNKDVVLPLLEPVCGKDGKLIREIPVTAGMEIIIGVLGCNANKVLWGEDALEWKPERWLSPLPTSVTEARIPGVYSNLMTFLGGKRGCLGFKFSEMEMKIVLSVLLSTFKFALTDKDIFWNVAIVWYPTVGQDTIKAQMPLKVELLSR
ncbi:cytochrome P450 [Laetiporus sulphureus 93-53]|uniref:Cytochrome P450 n=1 Tax=Laetiporus sulphureus 93-53 TaxID=1314785 RepID=A0A165GCS1_9APHY|nr:cytochrome P450 [Laetiporus sulphureus 93-53]KZT10168.1 cytochrome P450 [Laetiporus sulphureus 93-53]